MNSMDDFLPEEEGAVDVHLPKEYAVRFTRVELEALAYRVGATKTQEPNVTPDTWPHLKAKLADAVTCARIRERKEVA